MCQYKCVSRSEELSALQLRAQEVYQPWCKTCVIMAVSGLIILISYKDIQTIGYALPRYPR